MLTRLLHLIRHNVIALIALFVALGGTSYAALNLPANSVGTRQLKNRVGERGQAEPVERGCQRARLGNSRPGRTVVTSSRQAATFVSTSTAGGETVRWLHTRFASNCMASVTPQRNFLGAGGSRVVDGFVTAAFNPRAGFLTIDGLVPDGSSAQVQSANVLIVCPSPGSQERKVRRAAALLAASARLTERNGGAGASRRREPATPSIYAALGAIIRGHWSLAQLPAWRP